MLNFSKAVVYRMYFGRNIGSTGWVADDDILRFLGHVVDQRIKGYTVFDGDGVHGVWDGDRERTWVLEIVNPLHASEKEMERTIVEIADVYKNQYNQESVMITRSEIEVAF